MRLIIFLLYNILILPILAVFLLLLSLFNRRYLKALPARFKTLQKLLSAKAPQSPHILFHVSSVGEYLMARPIMKELKKQRPGLKIVLSFFSPSLAEWLEKELSRDFDSFHYLFFDDLISVRALFNAYQPKALIIVKNDLWPNLIWEANARSIPSFLFSAHISKSLRNIFPINIIFKNVLSCFEHISTENTNYDWVIKRKELLQDFSLPKDNSFRLVVGSSWPLEEGTSFAAFQKLGSSSIKLQLWIAPHDLSRTHIEELVFYSSRYTSKAIRLSEFEKAYGMLFGSTSGDTPSVPNSALSSYDIIIVDSLAKLFSLYSFADAAYIASGRGGIHNILEPAAFGVPILMGPRHKNSQDAEVFLKKSWAFCIKNSDDLCLYIERLSKAPQQRQKIKKELLDYIAASQGASQKAATRVLEKVDV